MLSEQLVRSLVVALLALSVAAPTPARAAEPGRDTSAGAIDRFIRGWMAANGVPVLALPVTHGARVVHLRGYGDAGGSRPLRGLIALVTADGTPGRGFGARRIGRVFSWRVSQPSPPGIDPLTPARSVGWPGVRRAGAGPPRHWRSTAQTGSSSEPRSHG